MVLLVKGSAGADGISINELKSISTRNGIAPGRKLLEKPMHIERRKECKNTEARYWNPDVRCP